MFGSICILAIACVAFVIFGLEVIPLTFSQAFTGDSHSLIIAACILVLGIAAIAGGYVTTRKGNTNIVILVGILSMLFFTVVMMLLRNPEHGTDHLFIQVISAIPSAIAYSFLPIAACALSSTIGKLVYVIARH